MPGIAPRVQTAPPRCLRRAASTCDAWAAAEAAMMTLAAAGPLEYPEYKSRALAELLRFGAKRRTNASRKKSNPYPLPEQSRFTDYHDKLELDADNHQNYPLELDAAGRKWAIEMLHSSSDDGVKCQVMEKIVQMIIGDSFQRDTLPTFTRDLSEYFIGQDGSRIFPSCDVTEETLMDSISTPVFVVFRNQYQLYKNRDSRAELLMEFLIGALATAPQIGYLFLYFLEIWVGRDGNQGNGMSIRATIGIPGVYKCCADSTAQENSIYESDNEIEFENKDMQGLSRMMSSKFSEINSKLRALDEKISIQQDTTTNQVNEIDARLKVLEEAQPANNIEVINSEIVQRMRRTANVVLFGVTEQAENPNDNSNDASVAIR
ncbi:hypothetical protein QAD02_013237 [Eretmocerus hayati]|uniref:Uncharacterized protein n=1 Tax=Eretmocerus hayati TaxID=131215 RepID=A0ACC2P223_9HYME|nr:hypothetical protein QAD02_013237 [Eretmocerus hayati]